MTRRAAAPDTRLPAASGRRRTSRAATAASTTVTFRARVIAIVRRIPPGRVATYGDVARLAGQSRAARAVGNILRDCGGIGIPAHRVIAAGGRLGGYGGNEHLKRSLLLAEGVPVRGSQIPWPRFQWQPGRHRDC